MGGWTDSDLLPSQPVNQSRGVGHLAATGLGVVLQVLLLLHGGVVQSLKISPQDLTVRHKNVVLTL